MNLKLSFIPYIVSYIGFFFCSETKETSIQNNKQKNSLKDAGKDAPTSKGRNQTRDIQHRLMVKKEKLKRFVQVTPI